MESFIKKINTMSDIGVLISLKEEIKSEVIKPMDWTERMRLYAQVDLINKHIQKLQDGE
ncbi:hypothetical protein [Aneurinibacillus tyrosinisolvens]|uniref:hypothetical protein n=1 Tax=Aneurinibacillus tyrosinisolvens TaxID=1443435 RepID=UPI000A6A7D59|nr:hypothetical protein [Aneurinibacillus tyrosinisolvens]